MRRLFLSLLIFCSLPAWSDSLDDLYKVAGWSDQRAHFNDALSAAQQRYRNSLPPAVYQALVDNSNKRFAAKAEAGPVSGKTLLRMGGSEQPIDWSKVARLPASAQARGSHWFGAPATERMYTNNTAFLPWQGAPGAAAQTLTLQQQGSGKPWATVQALAAVPVKALGLLRGNPWQHGAGLVCGLTAGRARRLRCPRRRPARSTKS